MSRYVPSSVRRVALGCALGAATLPWLAPVSTLAQQAVAQTSTTTAPGVPARKPRVPETTAQAAPAPSGGTAAIDPGRPLPVPAEPSLQAAPIGPAGRRVPAPPGLQAGVPPEIAGTEIPAPPPDMPQTLAPAGVQFDTPVPPPSPGEPRQITSMPGLPRDQGGAPPPQVAAIPPTVPPGDLPTGTEFRVIFPDSASESLSPKDTALLNGVAARLRQNDTIRLQVMGYASGTPETNRDARRLSLERALAVRGYLVDQGIRPTRIDVRALGFQAPDGPTDRVDLLLVN
ncbi:hypothetical protein N825_14710 [Skermanella stibiiresistens SB22]|uniref:OmpA-like domain-containing protein n=1 Tax=Skermanella stibiiresistens SB22 TaxID=1385369 RepID=W9H380_9PROT|nr:OmpA family protein [Skermanella stibiiresistens]EWY38218.1 hypothetical protein N825_14710 [Skermanella stibiiresistens SB22]